MAVDTSITFEENDETPTPKTKTQRARWATQHKKGKSGTRKRMSILNRLHHRPSQNSEKTRDSEGSMGTDLGSVPARPQQEDVDQDADASDLVARTVYFNMPLPAHAADENGHPLVHYRRNKIRTSKYTPLTFIPKDLWYQFHNIANIYFFALIILSVSSYPP
jgi:phospholipid-translocating ATPase